MPPPSKPRRASPALLRRFVAEGALLATVGVFMALLGPFGSSENSLGERMIYWLILIPGGGVFGIAIDEILGRRLGGFWRRLAADSILMTPMVTALVVLVSHLMFGGPLPPPRLLGLVFQVFVVCIAVMALRQLAWREGPVVVTSAPDDAPDSASAFRQRLSARRRQAALLAVEAEDHYLRVHTDAGEELITLRFADALDELAATPGFRTHRSWWVAASALEAVRWRRGRGEARLRSGLMVPVSRGQAATLKAAGWR